MKTGDARLGRPPLPEYERCTRINFRLDGEARDALAIVCDAYGQNQSAVVRRLLIERARRLQGKVGK